MVTVGYGDISPTTPNEKILVMFITMVAVGVFGYTLNTISSVALSIGKDREE